MEQREENAKMLIGFKTKKMSVSSIEQELKLGNGRIAKAAKGVAALPTDKFELLERFYATQFGIGEPIKEKTNLVVAKSGELKTVPSKATNERLKKVMDDFNKKYGAGSIMTFGDKPQEGYEVISTGSVGLDLATGIGGLPLGRMVEIFGLESSGKTTIALNVIANAQKKGLTCLMVDAENSFDPEYAYALGVNVDELKYCQPSSGEAGLEAADTMIRSGEVRVVVIDSVAALVPQAELSGEMGESKMGLHARLMSQACRKLTGIVASSGTLIVWINQIRNKIGVMWGSPEVVTGGLALQFYASMRMHVTRSTSVANSITNEHGDKEGNLTTVKVIKNKCASPFQSAAFNIIYGVGIDKSSEILDIGMQMEILKKEGNTISYNGTKLGVGKEAVKQFLDDNTELRDDIEQKLITQK